ANPALARTWRPQSAPAGTAHTPPIPVPRSRGNSDPSPLFSGTPVNNGALSLNASPVMADPPEGGPGAQRRVFLKGVAAGAGPPLVSRVAAAARDAGQHAGGVRPGEPGWAGPAEWAKLREDVGGRLVQVESPFAACMPDPGGAACTGLFQNLQNPFYIGDSVALTQTLGWTADQQPDVIEAHLQQ